MISKSSYKRYIECPKSLWLYFNKPNEAAEMTELEKGNIENGNIVGELARMYFPNTVDCSVTKSTGEPIYNKQIEATKKAFQDGADAMAEASFLIGDLFCAVDILKKEEDGYSIYEVKSSLDVTESQLLDIAFQKYVLDKCGIRIKHIYLMHPNRNYTLNGNLNLAEYFSIECEDKNDTVIKCYIVDEIKKNEVNELFVSRFVKKTVDTYFFANDKAEWAVKQWCGAFGFESSTKTVQVSNNVSDSIKTKTYSSAKIGDVIKFGSYPQNADGKDKTPIEWRVLDVKDGKALIISEYALDCQRYNTSYTDVTWEICSLRQWMNGTFLNNAFSAEEQAQIQNTTVSADENLQWGTNPGNATTDKVLLLSIPEAEKYFTTDEDRKCVPTAYAIAQGAFTNSDFTKGGKATCFWWLRSPGDSQHSAVRVDRDGSVSYRGSGVLGAYSAVRPALWITIL